MSGDFARDAPPSSGFNARVEGIELADLIQMNGMSRGRAACRVLSWDREGHLFFEDGRVAHASFGDVRGVDAVAHMLALGTGTFEPCALAWPTSPNLNLPADVLLLHAAQRLDDLRRTGARLPSVRPLPPAGTLLPGAAPSGTPPVRGSLPPERAGMQQTSCPPGARRTRSGTFLYRGKRY